MTATAAGLFVLGNAAALLLAAVFATSVCRDRSREIRWIALIGIYLLIISLSTLAIGLLGRITSWSPAVALAVSAIAIALVRRKSLAADLRTLVPRIDAETCRSELGTLLAPVLALTIGLAALWFVKYTLLGTFLTFDDKTYHAPHLVHWLQTGRIALTSYSYQSYYSCAAELPALWFMIPAGSDAFVPIIGLIYAALFMLISLELGRRWQLPPWCRLVPALLFLSSVEIVSQCNWFADVDVAAPVTMLAALAIGCRDSSPARRRQMLLAGALAGFAAGMKPNFAVFAAVLMVIVAGRIFLRSRLSDGALPKPPSVRRLSFFGTIANGLGFFTVAIVAGGYWYLRNFLLTGNPLYPAKVGPFDGPFTPEEQSATTLAHALSNNQLQSNDYAELFEMIFGWPAIHAVLAMLAVIVCGLAVVRLRKGPTGSTAATAVTLTCFAVLCIALAPWMPFSARGDDGNFYLKGSSRYLTIAYASGFLLMPRLLAWIGTPTLNRKEQWLSFAGLALLLTIPLGTAIDPLFALCCALVACAALIMLQLAAAPDSKISGHAFALILRPSYWLAAFAALLVYITAAAPTNLRATDRMHLSTWMNAQIDKLPPGSTVTMYYGLRPEIYTLYGRRWQLDPVRLRGDGLPAEALHLRDPNPLDEDFFDKAFDQKSDVTAQVFLANLRSTGVDFVVTPTMPHRHDGWPLQHALLTELNVPVWCQSEKSVIWDLRKSATSTGEIATSRP